MLDKKCLILPLAPSLSPVVCLRVAASAKAGEREGMRGVEVLREVLEGARKIRRI